MPTITDMEPKRLWYYFNEICNTPHGSGNEKALREFVVKKATEFGLEYRVDDAGNVLVRKEGKAKNKSGLPVILQGHMDMVCEKDVGVNINFDKDPIKTVIDYGWLKAQGTTLGGDNGIAVAASLAIMEDKNLVHGPLEFLFTIEEETTMRGATSITSDYLKGRTLLNMDSEEEGQLFISCSSSEGMVVDSNLKKTSAPAGSSGLKLTLQGLLGGHSGLDIHLQRGNAVKLLNRVLIDLNEKCGAAISSIHSGERANAIPRDATAIVAIPKNNEAKAKDLITAAKENFRSELGSVAKDLDIKVESVMVNDVIDNNDAKRVLRFIHLAPSAPVSVSPYVADLVQSSCNLGITNVEPGSSNFVLSRRSSAPTESASVGYTVKALTELCGFNFTEKPPTPGWKPNMNSEILKVMKETCKKVYGKAPEVKGMHASLECAVIGEKYPDMDMISFGVTIENCHSPSERVNIKSVEGFWRWLTVTLEDLTK